MDRAVEDATPAEEWSQSLNATCNRLSTQYSNLLKSASSVTALAEENKHDPRAGGGHMISAQDPPPPPLAADVALASLQCQLASENICVATSHLLSLIRTLRLSLLLMDEDTIDAEESLQVQETKRMTEQAMTKAIQLEQQLMIQRQESLNR
jgi:hypothetical protein